MWLFLFLWGTLTQGCSGAVSNHEARVESALVDQEGGQLAEGGVAQPLHPALADGGQLVDRNA